MLSYVRMDRRGFIGEKREERTKLGSARRKRPVYIRIVKGRPRGAKREINHFPANGLTSVIKLISQLCAAKTG